MKVTQNTADTLVIDSRGGYASILFIPLLCLFLWLHWLAFGASAPIWVHLLIGAFTIMIAAIVIYMPERCQVVLDRKTGKAELRRRKGPTYTSLWFELRHIAAFEINPEGAGFSRRPGPMERVYVYMHVKGGMDEGYYLLKKYASMRHPMNKLVKTAANWLGQTRP